MSRTDSRFLAAFAAVILSTACSAQNVPLPKEPFSDYRTQKPGVVHKITPADLPAPYATKSVDTHSGVVDRPGNALPKVPAGFKVELYATGLKNPRLIRTAPNGDVFLAESDTGKI